MKEEFIIIEHSIQYKDSGCYPTETYVHVYDVGGGFETKEDAQKFLDQKYADLSRRMNFPAYTNKKALGNYFGNYLYKSVKEFQRRTGLENDGNIGPLTLAKLEQYGFKY